MNENKEPKTLYYKMSDVPQENKGDNDYRIRTYISMTDDIFSQILYTSTAALKGSEREKEAQKAQNLIWRIMNRDLYEIILKEEVEEKGKVEKEVEEKEEAEKKVEEKEEVEANVEENEEVDEEVEKREEVEESLNEEVIIQIRVYCKLIVTSFIESIYQLLCIPRSMNWLYKI